jgi:putative ABC transport system ATP-binding protein
LIEAKGATLTYMDHGREVFACRDIDLKVNTNEFLGILGPSGSGKSSLLYLLSGLKTPTRGDVLYNGVSIPGLPEDDRNRLRLSDFGFVFQQPYLLGYLTAVENVLLANPKAPDRNEALKLLDSLGLSTKTHRLPHELSGGERQRVCVARAILGQPKVIFADEPTASLDHKNGVAVVELLNRLRGQGSLVMVTHDATMLTEADRVVRIVEGQLAEPQS